MCVPEFAPGDGADDGHLLVHRQARGVGLNTTLAISKIIKNCTVFCTKTVYSTPGSDRLNKVFNTNKILNQKIIN